MCEFLEEMRERMRWT